jgi:apolipoprotein D and lipocalin family protein
LLANNQVKGLNVCRKANGELYKISCSLGKYKIHTNSKIGFKITSSWLRFIPMIRADYWIIDLADDYSYAAISTPDAKNYGLLRGNPR